VGHSMVIDPWGTILAGAGDDDLIVKTQIEPKKVRIDLIMIILAKKIFHIKIY